MKDYNKFTVDFLYLTEKEELELELLLEDDDFDEDDYLEKHTYSKALDISFDDDEFEDFLHSDIVSDIEQKYGILDVVGDNNEIGFSSYEINIKDAPIVWEELVKALKTFIK